LIGQSYPFFVVLQIFIPEISLKGQLMIFAQFTRGIHWVQTIKKFLAQFIIGFIIELDETNDSSLKPPLT
jgi:hypothetical protein